MQKDFRVKKKSLSGSHLSIEAPEVFSALYVRKRSLADMRGL